MFEIVDKAKLKTRHLEKFVGVSRITASRWLNEHQEPHVQLIEKVNKFLAFVKWCVEEKHLPFPSGVTKGDENNYLRELLRKFEAL